MPTTHSPPTSPPTDDDEVDDDDGDDDDDDGDVDDDDDDHDDDDAGKQGHRARTELSNTALCSIFYVDSENGIESLPGHRIVRKTTFLYILVYFF